MLCHTFPSETRQGTPSRFRERSSTPAAMPAAFRGGRIVGGVGDVVDVEYKWDVVEVICCWA